MYFSDGLHGSQVHALDARMGNKTWIFKPQGSVQSSPAIGTNGMVYLGANTPGSMRWTHRPARLSPRPGITIRRWMNSPSLLTRRSIERPATLPCTQAGLIPYMGLS